LLLLFHDFAIFLFNAAQSVEVLWVDYFSQDAGIQEAAGVDAGDSSPHPPIGTCWSIGKDMRDGS